MIAIENREENMPPLEANRAVHLFGHKLRHQLFGRHQQRGPSNDTETCRRGGFRMIQHYQGARSQLRELDRCNKRYIGKFRKKFAQSNMVR